NRKLTRGVDACLRVLEQDREVGLVQVGEETPVLAVRLAHPAPVAAPCSITSCTTTKASCHAVVYSGFHWSPAISAIEPIRPSPRGASGSKLSSRVSTSTDIAAAPLTRGHPYPASVAPPTRRDKACHLPCSNASRSELRSIPCSTPAVTSSNSSGSPRMIAPASRPSSSTSFR